jgi:hypothetical protein
MSLSTLLRNLRLRATLAQEQKRRAEAELEITTLQRRLSAHENNRPRDAKRRYAQKSEGTTCKRYQPHQNA